MALFRVTYTLMLILLTVLVSGCMLPQGAVNETSITAINVTKISSTPIIEPVTPLFTIQTQCPVGKNTTPYITINPVGDHYLGDVIEINGTTNCEMGEVQTWVKDIVFRPGCQNRKPIRWRMSLLRWCHNKRPDYSGNLWQ